MRRWNGWGDADTHYPLPDSAAAFLEERIGRGSMEPDAELSAVLSKIPESRLSSHPLISTDPYDRLMHARGQSLPDWIALRSGRIGVFPDGVAYPKSDVQMQRLIKDAYQMGIRLIPYGGGTSVVGHINPLPGAAPNLTVDLSGLDKVIDLDEASRIATLGAGLQGPLLEKKLNQRGYTLGHFPQSFELSTLGGWIATRSSGQQSYHYGRIEDLLAGAHVETPQGSLDLPPLPASAAGPDLRQVLLGSEGRLGVITSAQMRIRPLPEVDAFFGAFFKDWRAGADAVREMAQEGLPLSMLRLSDEQETETTLILSGKERLVSWADRGLSLLGFRDQRCLLIYGITGSRRMAGKFRHRANEILRDYGGLPTGKTIGSIWRKSRFHTPYLRNTLWEKGYVLDTLETALPWRKVLPTAEALKHSIQQTMEVFDEKVLVFAHISHVYTDGASIYVTFIFRRSADPEGTLAHWNAMKAAASHIIAQQNGTISHQHGVGMDHIDYLSAEKGRLGIEILTSVFHSTDPKGLLNPGKLLPQSIPGSVSSSQKEN